MKTSFLTLLFALSLNLNVACGGGSALPPTEETPIEMEGTSSSNTETTGESSDIPRTKVFAAIVTHNEQRSNTKCRAVLEDEEAWHENRAIMVEFVKAIVEAGGAYDLQTDFSWLEKMREWETDQERTTTDGKNFLEWVATSFPGQTTVDPHNHDSTHNYADVAYLLSEVGVPDTGVVGGLIWHPVSSQDWERFRTPLSGLRYPDKFWKGEILWGAATHLHMGPDSEATGIWRPQSAESFHEHDPSGDLIYMGNYINAHFSIGAGEGVQELLDQVSDNAHPEGVMLTASVFTDQCGMTSEKVDAIRAMIARHQTAVDSGDLVWATVPDIITTWKTDYKSKPYISNEPDLEEIPASCECAEGQVCCVAPFPCAGQCVTDCRSADDSCPQETVCSEDDGLCR